MASSISVAVRVRPPTEWEQERLPNDFSNEPLFQGDGHLAYSPQKFSSARSLRPIIQVMDDKVLVFDPKDPDTTRAFEQRGFMPPGTKRYKDMRYAFDRVFDETARQIDVFEATTQPLLDGLLNGFNATVFAYGATGCGKTHTISGTTADPGIIYLTMAELFQRIDDKRDEMLCEVSLSFLEIYNEEIRDLLSDIDAPVPRGGLAMRDDQSNRVTVPGLTERRPANADEVKQMVIQGNERRTQSPTHANQTSSRSHAVLQVSVTQTARTAGTTELRTMATLSIIDLAGSERASATSNMGQRMVEGANINKSLLALGNCINALCEGGNRTRHVPYRNSKLTRLLRFSLGGNCKTCMIVCIAPASNHFEDTQNTLKYANRAKEIKTKVSRNFINVDRHVGQYVEAINRLNEEVAQLKAKLAGKLGGEADVLRRKKAEAKAELDRVKSDLQAKADQTRKTLIEGAVCEAHLSAAMSRLAFIEVRLNVIDQDSRSGPLSSDLLAEQALLRSLAHSDEQVLLPDSAVNRQLQKSSNSSSMFDATMRAVSERRSDRLDEFGVDSIKVDAECKRALMDKARAETRETVFRSALDGQAKLVADLVGLLARCTVMMADGSIILSRASTDEINPVAARVAESLKRVASGNEAAFASLIGHSTTTFQSSKDSALLKFTGYAMSSSSALHAASLPRASLRGSDVSVSTRRRSSAGISSSAVRGNNSPRRLLASGRSSVQRQVRNSLSGRNEPARRQIEKKSVRWRDEASQGEIDDNSSRVSVVREANTPISSNVFLDGASSKVREESDAEWEDERTDADDSLSFSLSTTNAKSVASYSIRSRLGMSSRPLTMSSLGEVSDEELTPRRPQKSGSGRLPLGDVVNSPPSSVSPTKEISRKRQDASNLGERSSTPPPSSATVQAIVPLRRLAGGLSMGLSTSKARRRSNIGPMRAEKVSRRRSSLIPRPSPPSSSYSYAYSAPRKTPSKKRRASVLSSSQYVENHSVAGDMSVMGAKSLRPASVQSFSYGPTQDTSGNYDFKGKRPAWR